MSELDLVRINFNPEQLKLLNLILAFLMFGVALDISRKDFEYVAKAWPSVLVGLTSQLLLLPILTLGLIYVFHPPAGVAIGMILVSVCPGGNISNYMVHLAKGNTALSVTLTSIVTIGSIFLTPVGLYFWASFTYASDFLTQKISVEPREIINTVILLIAIPLFIGMIIRQLFPKFTEYIKSPIQKLSMIVFLGFVVVAIGSNTQNIIDHMYKVLLMVIAHNILALSTGYFFSKLLGRSEYDSRAICIETGIQNSGLALILIFNFFDGIGSMALIAGSWGIWHLVSGGVMGWYWGRRE